MDPVLKGLPFAWCYIDDVIIFSDSPSEHVRHLQQVFERLRAWGLRLHHGKCKFFHDTFTLSRTYACARRPGVQMAKVEALNKIPIPRDVPRLRAFLGLANDYRRFVCNFSVIAKLLIQLTSTGQDWKWGPA